MTLLIFLVSPLYLLKGRKPKGLLKFLLRGCHVNRSYPLPANDLFCLCSVKKKIIGNLGVPEGKPKPNFLLAKVCLSYSGQTGFYLVLVKFAILLISPLDR